MSWIVTTAPTEEPVSVERALTHLKTDAATEDEQEILGWIKSAREYVEDRCELAIMPQVWTKQLKSFPVASGPIELPGGLVRKILSLTYLDASGVENAIEESGFEQDLLAKPPHLLPPYGCSWPSGRRVRVAYEVGFKTAQEVPERIKSAILLMVGDLEENRSSSVVGVSIAQNDTVDRLLRGLTRVLP